MAASAMQGVALIAIDNDKQDLSQSRADFKIWINENRRRRLGPNPK
jgi:cell division GTPase FtsZ